MKKIQLQLKNLSVCYPDKTLACDKISFRLETGKCLAIVGESGSGKSTIARAILNLLPKGTKRTGSILFNEKELVGISEKKMRQIRGTRIGFISQDPYAACNPVLSVFRHVAEAWHAHGLTFVPDKIITAFSSMGIRHSKEQAGRYPHEWSGGMLQRAEITAASIHHPSVIIADEPTSALDKDLADSILRLIVSLDSAILLISHDLSLVSDFADDIAVCYAGQLVEMGSVTRITNHPRHPYTQALMNAVCKKGGLLPEPLSGSVPDLKQVSSACSFAPRCRYKMEKCLNEAPGLIQGVACHLNDKTGLQQWEPTIDLLNESKEPTFNESKLVLELIGISKRFKESSIADPILDGINLALKTGEIIGVCGSSGSGKSTLLKIVSGIEIPDTGMIRYGSDPLWKYKGKRVIRCLPRNGYTMSVFQNPYSSLDQRWPIWRSITEPAMAAHCKTRPSNSHRKLVAARLLKNAGLSQLNGLERPSELSVGQCQRVCILRALFAKPAVILADEPTSALDVTSAAGIYKLFKDYACQGIAMIIVSHDETGLHSFCDSMFRLSGGKLSRIC